ncbi:MAG: hypothetical protein CTY36_02560 [Methylocystis sp.]|nr:MAG: hypothetical protein CTY36_02560 [Methylocystis sp.]
MKRPSEKGLRACTIADKRDMAVKNECKKCYIGRNFFGFSSALNARRQFRHASSAAAQNHRALWSARPPPRQA